MRYMVVERFVRGAEPVYRRAAESESGRMLPEGLEYVDSWWRRGSAAAFS